MESAAQAYAGTVIEHVPAAIAVFDTHMRYIAHSRRWLVDYDLGEQPLIGRSHYDVFPEMPEAWREVHRRALAGEALSHEAQAFARANGDIDWVEWNIAPWRYASGEIGGVVLISQVVTGEVRKRQRAEALQSELDLLIDRADQIAICMLDEAGNVIGWNIGAERLYGWTEAEIMGRSHGVTFTLRDRDAGLPAAQLEAARRDGAFHGSSLRRRKDGTAFLVSVTLNRIGPDGTGGGFILAVHDVTDEFERAREAEADEAFQRAILETVPDAMITIDSDGSVLSFSSAAERLFGYRAEEVLGRNVKMLMPEREAALHDGYLSRYHRTGERRIIGEVRRVMGRRKDGTLFPHAIYVGEANGGGRRVFTGFLRDLTAQDEAERQLRELQSELFHLSRVSAVGTLAVALAHELNQPLAAIANYVQTSAALLAQEARAHPEDGHLDDVRKALDQAGKEALRAGAIVHRVREFVTRGELERTVASPYEIAVQTRELAAIDASSRKISCRILMSRMLPMIFIDRVEIQQVLLNLIRNAVEAVDEHGSIVIDARREGDMIRFSVIDDGPGIMPGMENSLFEPFVSTKSTGMGIGLAICRTIVEAHGGRLWCEPAPGGGAAFQFTLPVAETEDD